ncbi:anti-sigma factor [Mesorhizobium sp.]|uniref:anti-sigma factor n=1 Tax=Mesorhizobium sp. TaxID=1871066 RepID=UPI000FE901D7|nr:anti-sigma factor [Mesorhizobium sp.]RWQ27920.1 MAG: anti-sigma factor [Mesorhizobium sp.]
MSAAEKMSRRDEMETLLPFYLNGSLEGAELEAVEEWLATDPAALAALGEAEAEFSGTAASNEAIRPPADALSRFARALDAEAGPTLAPAGVAWAAVAALLALVVMQSFERPGGIDSDFEIAGQQGDLAKMPFALVTFKPDAKMADIVAFLGEHQLKIAGGPTAEGVFRLGIPAATVADYEKVLGLIAAQPFAEAVVEGRKPVDGG